MKFNYKGFEIERVVATKKFEFYDRVQLIKCYALKITYPSYKYNVMIDHEPINKLESERFYYAKSIKKTTKHFIDLFFKNNKSCFKEMMNNEL